MAAVQYLVGGEAVQLPDGPLVSLLELTQVGQQRELSEFIATLVFPGRLKSDEVKATPCGESIEMIYRHHFFFTLLEWLHN